MLTQTWLFEEVVSFFLFWCPGMNAAFYLEQNDPTRCTSSYAREIPRRSVSNMREICACLFQTRSCSLIPRMSGFEKAFLRTKFSKYFGGQEQNLSPPGPDMYELIWRSIKQGPRTSKNSLPNWINLVKFYWLVYCTRPPWRRYNTQVNRIWLGLFNLAINFYSYMYLGVTFCSWLP